MKFNKKLFSLLFVALLALVLVGCNGEGTTTEAPGTDAPTTEAPTTEAPTSVDVDFQEAIEILQVVYVDTLEKETFLATDDLTLIESYGDFTFTWSSNNTAYIANDGSVTRPLLTDGNQTVILTATISQGDETETYDFFVTVKALEEKTVEEIRDEVFLFVFAIPDNEFWTSADSPLNLTEVGKDDDDNEYDITWESSHPDIISTDGEITQPEGDDVDVTLTATFTVDDTEFSQDRVFTVAKMTEGTEVSTIQAAIDMGQDAYVEILGVTVIAMYDSGDVFFTDGIDILYIYSPPFDAVIGEVYDITGNIDFYYNAPQLAGTDTQPLRAVDSDAAVSTSPVVEDVTVNDIISVTSVPSSENPHEYTSYEVTASVYYEESWGNYSLFLVPTDYDFDADLASGATQPNGDSIMIYYRSDMDALKAFHGEEITIDIIMQGYRTDKSVFYGNFFGTALDVGLTFDTDDEAADTALAIFDFPKTINVDTTLDLFDTAYGVDFAITSNNSDVFDATTGAIDVSGLDAQEVLTITITATINDVTKVETFDIKVGPLPVMTISNFIDLTIGDLGKVEGTVIAGGYYGSFFIADESGYIALNVYDDDFVDLLERNVGNIVAVSGERSVYNGLIQMRVNTVEFIENPSIPEPLNIDGFTLDEDGLLDYQSQLVELTGMIIRDIDTSNFGNYEITLERISDGETIFMKWDSRYDLPAALMADLEALEVGDKVDVVTILSWYNGPQLAVVTTTEFTVQDLTDQDMVTLDVREMGTELELTADYDYEDGMYGSTISILEIFGTASNFVDVDTTPGTLAVTTVYGTDVTATVTFKVLSGTVEEIIQIELTIPGSSLLANTTDLIISEYGEGSSHNKWIEIYNGTGADVDLTDYKVVVYSNGSTEAGNTEDLTGTLADGEVLVIYNASAVAAITDEGDVESTATYFNGDDAVALVKDETIIDIILSVGHTNDDYQADERTWVRKDSVLSPNATFTVAEWDEYAADTFTYIGTHEVETVEMDDATKVNADLAALDFGGIIKSADTIILPINGDNGTTITWTKPVDDDSNATMNATNDEVTFTEAPADNIEIVELQAVVTLNDASLTGTFVYKVEGVTDADRVAADKEEVEALNLGGDAYVEVSVSLPQTGSNSSTITWAITTDDDSLATLTGSNLVINRAEGTDSVVVLTGTITKGAESDTVVVTYNMMGEVTDLSVFHEMTDGTNYDIPNGTELYIKGIVTRFEYNGIFIQDSNGIGLYLFEADTTGVEIGDEVIYFGALGAYNSARQLSSTPDLIEIVSSDNQLVVTPITADEIDALTGADSGTLFSFDGFVYKGIVGNDMTFEYTLSDGTTVNTYVIEYFTNWEDLTHLDSLFSVDDTLPTIEFLVTDIRSEEPVLKGFKVIFTDAQAIQIDSDSVPDELVLADDMDIPTGEYGSTYEVTGITGDAAANIDYTTTPGTLLVTRPAEGQTDLTGTMTIEVSNGTETPIEVTVNVVVKAEVAITELFISEYGEGSSSNKWIEIYNGTDADVDLSSYSLKLNSNANTEWSNEIVLSGTLAAGEVYVIYNSSSVSAISDEGDITSSVTYFNGDDAIGLFKNDTLIDLFGVFGVDPGSAWDVETGDGATANHTLVRKATVSGPTTTWDPAEWDVYDQDTFDYIGSHTAY